MSRSKKKSNDEPMERKGRRNEEKVGNDPKSGWKIKLGNFFTEVEAFLFDGLEKTWVQSGNFFEVSV